MRLYEAVVNERTDAREPSAHPPGTKELRCGVSGGVPPFAHTDDAAVLGQHAQFPCRMTAGIEFASPSYTSQFEDALLQMIHEPSVRGRNDERESWRARCGARTASGECEGRDTRHPADSADPVAREADRLEDFPLPAVRAGSGRRTPVIQLPLHSRQPLVSITPHNRRRCDSSDCTTDHRYSAAPEVTPPVVQHVLNNRIVVKITQC